MELGDIMRNGQDWFTNLQTVSQSEEPRHAPQDLAMHDVTESHLNQTNKSRHLQLTAFRTLVIFDIRYSRLACLVRLYSLPGIS
jgi:hypothetical protein